MCKPNLTRNCHRTVLFKKMDLTFFTFSVYCINSKLFTKIAKSLKSVLLGKSLNWIFILVKVII